MHVNLLVIVLLGVLFLIPISAFAHSDLVFDSYAKTVPSIDRIIDSGEWNDATYVEYDLSLPNQYGQGDWPLHVTLYEKNDVSNLYFLAKIDGTADVDWHASWIEYRFDANHNLQYYV